MGTTVTLPYVSTARSSFSVKLFQTVVNNGGQVFLFFPSLNYVSFLLSHVMGGITIIMHLLPSNRFTLSPLLHHSSHSSITVLHLDYTPIPIIIIIIIIIVPKPQRTS